MGFTVRCDYEASGTKTTVSEWNGTYEERITDVQTCLHRFDDDISNYHVINANIPKGSLTESDMVFMSYTGEWEYERNVGDIQIKVVYQTVELNRITVVSWE